MSRIKVSNRIIRDITVLTLSLMLIVMSMPTSSFASDTSYTSYFVYTDTGITAYSCDEEGNYSETTENIIACTEPGSTCTTKAGDGFILDGTQITITADTLGHECYYFFTGECCNGNIFVEKDASEEIELELQGLELTEPDEGSCPIQIKGGSTRVKIKAKKGTNNVLTDAAHVGTDGEAVSPRACINASKKVSLGGKGTLTVNGNNKNGIKSDTKIEINSQLTLNVNSVDNAISADKEILVSDEFSGTININSDGKGICGVFDEEDLESGDEWTEYDNVLIKGGTINIEAADDAIHSNRNIEITGGTLNLNSSDDAVHADEQLVIGTEQSTEKDTEENTEKNSQESASNAENPKINITNSYEGLESMVVDIYSGDIDIVASDDGVNAVSSKSPYVPTNQDETGQQVEACGDKNCNINIYGGDIYVLAGADGFDSNGNITISGGNTEIYSSVKTRGFDSNALDAYGEIIFKEFDNGGGTVFACSAEKTNQQTPKFDEQEYLMQTVQVASGGTVSIADNGTNVTYTLPCRIGFIIYTSPTYAGGEVTTTGGVDEENPGQRQDSSQGQKSTPTHVHRIVKVSARAATCTSKGNKTYWKCTKCNKLFADAEGKTETTLAANTTASLGHNYQVVGYVAAGYLKNGHTTYKCTRCSSSYTICSKGYSKSYVQRFKVSGAKASFTAKWKKQSKKVQKKFSGYQIRYSTKSSMNGAVYRNVGRSKSSVKITKLARRKNYYVQVRTYKTVTGKKYYSSWSAVKRTVTK